MTAGIIISLCFCFVALLALVLSIVLVKKRPLTLYLRACSVVYISGVGLTLLLACLKQSLPTVFFLLSNILVTVVFIASCGLLFWATKKFAAIEAEEKAKREAEPKKEEADPVEDMDDDGEIG